MSLQHEPFRHLVIDNFGHTDAWPERSDCWVSYRSELECKWALNDWSVMPDEVRRLLASLLLLPASNFLGLGEQLIPDLGLWGAGLHEMGPGGFLSLHLDSDIHRWTGLERRVNAVLFLSEWAPDWGGELEFWCEEKRTPAVSILPAKGRLVLFEVSDRSYHRVNTVCCPINHTRRSLAAFWYGKPLPDTKRPRALFLPIPGEASDPIIEQLRTQRAA